MKYEEIRLARDSSLRVSRRLKCDRLLIVAVASNWQVQNIRSASSANDGAMCGIWLHQPQWRFCVGWKWASVFIPRISTETVTYRNTICCIDNFPVMCCGSVQSMKKILADSLFHAFECLPALLRRILYFGISPLFSLSRHSRCQRPPHSVSLCTLSTCSSPLVRLCQLTVAKLFSQSTILPQRRGFLCLVDKVGLQVSRPSPGSSRYSLDASPLEGTSQTQWLPNRQSGKRHCFQTPLSSSLMRSWSTSCALRNIYCAQRWSANNLCWKNSF